MNDALKAEVLLWLRYAQEDSDAAQRLSSTQDSVPRHAAWLAQQAAEKALKAILIYEQIEFPRTHDLDALRSVMPERWRVSLPNVDFARLSEYAVDARYPAHTPEISENQAAKAVSEAATLVDYAVASLRLVVGQ